MPATWPVWGRLLAARGPINSTRPRPTRSTWRRWSSGTRLCGRGRPPFAKTSGKQEAKEYAELAARVDRLELKDGTTLNNLLAQILDIDPAGLKSGRANAPISPAAIREIPFEWDSEAVTFCLDEMTGQGALPTPLMAPMYAEDRQALHAAVQSALEEDRKGTVSMATVKRINEVIARFRAKFMKNSMETDLGYEDALTYFTTMASLSRLLNDPSMKDFLAKLGDNEETNVGDLLAFMNSHNLRFGPATTDRQIALYYAAGAGPDGDPRSGQDRGVCSDAPGPQRRRLEGGRQERVQADALGTARGARPRISEP